MIIHMPKHLQHQTFVLFHMYMEVSHLAFTQLLMSTLRSWALVLLYTATSIFISSHTNYDFRWLWTTATKFISIYSLWPENILTYVHFITSAFVSSPHSYLYSVYSLEISQFPTYGWKNRVKTFASFHCWLVQRVQCCEEDGALACCASWWTHKPPALVHYLCASHFL